MIDDTPHPMETKTHHAEDKLSIWFFCGTLLFACGVVLVGQGIYERFGHMPTTMLAELQPTLWWGLLMTVLGAIYTWKFRPRRRSTEH